MDMNEWFFGAGDFLKANLESLLGITVIENYIIGWIFSFGLLGAIPLLISVFLLPIKMVSNMQLNAKIAILTMLFVSITNNALSVKTMALFFIFTILSCMYHPYKK